VNPAGKVVIWLDIPLANSRFGPHPVVETMRWLAGEMMKVFPEGSKKTHGPSFAEL
jgi:hypothetical protein